MMVSAETSVGERTFIGWPFLQDGLVLVPDLVFKYAKMAVVPGSPPTQNPHTPHGVGHWKTRAEWIEIQETCHDGQRYRSVKYSSVTQATLLEGICTYPLFRPYGNVQWIPYPLQSTFA